MEKDLIKAFLDWASDEARLVRDDVRMGHAFEVTIDGDELDAMIDSFLAEREEAKPDWQVRQEAKLGSFARCGRVTCMNGEWETLMASRGWIETILGMQCPECTQKEKTDR